ncbi:10439_t:CDS:1, partial [Funneliformis caledonium]
SDFIDVLLMINTLYDLDEYNKSKTLMSNLKVYAAILEVSIADIDI